MPTIGRLRRKMPEALFLGGFWRLEANNPAHSIVIGSIGADDVISTLAMAVDRCLRHEHGATFSNEVAGTVQTLSPVLTALPA